ncbi:MAG TPA: peptide chain release factor N(5)-glutamine methyltransferase, partial [Allosphingosinicella sp.]|nr:peptide chain release factor N(5)-glutamine methyltransferase [Allosphingosinicella sp.]
ALEFAELNAIDLELEGRARFRVGDWARGLDGQFDLILCNPPYVEQGADLPREVADWEPDAALYAGPDGLDAYRRLAPEVPRLLAPDGVACFEIGAGQAEAAGALFEAEGLHVSLRKDLGGRDRCLILRR